MGWIFYILVFLPVVGVTVTNAVHTILCKVWQYITLMRRIYLIDCPGVVYPTGDTDTEIVLKGVVRLEVHEGLERNKRSVHLLGTHGLIKSLELFLLQNINLGC